MSRARAMIGAAVLVLTAASGCDRARTERDAERAADQVKAAAEQVLPAERAKRFAGSHLRSARITHLAESSQNLPGVQFIVGHKLISTIASASAIHDNQRVASVRLTAAEAATTCRPNPTSSIVTVANSAMLRALLAASGEC